MSIQSEISRIQSNVQDTINVIQSTGVAVPPGANSDNLPGLATALANKNMACRTCRFVIGTSTSGWTSDDCDYLCDGTADDVEINAAIQALPSTGGEVVILDGTYNITATIATNKDNVKLSGNGMATILQRGYDSSTAEGVITITAANGGCCIENLQIDGNKATYTSNSNYGIYLSGSNNNNTITGNTCNNNAYGISLNSSNNNNTITGNTCNDNNNTGIYLSGSSNNNTITGNTCNDNNAYGIYLSSSNNNTITGNTCNDNNNTGISLNSSNNNTITGNTCNDNNNTGIYLSGSSNNNTITGNTCNNNGKGIHVINSGNNTVTGNTVLRGTGTSSDYASSQHTIYLVGATNNYNLIADNNIMGKNYVSRGGTGNTFVNNKYN